ncbi:EAL domain-containing protein [Pseudoalteromonas luteoviolacea]|uniref:EAL domain-containing protein n=1 Tax=Pseudoalteromonas luteoviolacea TaxID=43657 RepID=UPI0011531E29|nr:EAL domain-containing protein [Pseudoalteromonas luteoviolacea]TQF71415.1 EAL domain-containing protein [Pseudoalteromonas luteoviolacea]
MSYRHLKPIIKASLHSKYLLSLREAFISLIPYFVSSALAIFILNSALAFNIITTEHYLYESVFNAASLILALFPVIVAISIGFFLCKNYGQSGIVGAMLALLCFSLHGQYIVLDHGAFSLNPTGAAPYAIIIPSISSLLLILMIKILPNFTVYFHQVSRFLSEKLLIIIPFFIVFLSFYTFMPLLNFIGNHIAVVITPDPGSQSIAELTFQRMVVIHGLWFVGIHGDNTFNMLFNADYLSQPILADLPAKTFYDTFVLMGGTGCFAGLLVAAFFLKRGCHERNIVKLSLPFTLFNFCEIVLFALPVFLNPIMLIPFIFTPIFNFIISYFAISAQWVSVSDVNTSWMLPTLISGYEVSGDFSGVLLQMVLIAVNALIYFPFLKKQSEQFHFIDAVNKLSDSLNIAEQLRQSSEQDFLSHRRYIEDSNKELQHILTEISNGKLRLFYQPQICQKTKSIRGFEALLRLQKTDGTITGPYFLDTLIKHDRTDIIDTWVIEQAQRDLLYFAKRSYKPIISINVNPKVLSDNVLIAYVCESFKQFPNQLKIEVVESGYLSDKKTVVSNIKMLKQHNIKTVIDDFGTGYSSLSMLADLPIDIVKLDKSMLDKAKTVNGEGFYTHVVELLHKMDKRLVAEGVETKSQLEFIRRLNVETVQGWYYQKAMPKDEVLAYVKAFRP